MEGTCHPGKRPLRLSGKTTDFTNGEAEPQRGELYSRQGSSLPPPDPCVSTLQGEPLQGSEGEWDPQRPFLTERSQPAEGVTVGATLSLAFAPTRLLSRYCQKGCFLEKRDGLRMAKAPLPLLLALPGHL